METHVEIPPSHLSFPGFKLQFCHSHLFYPWRSFRQTNRWRHKSGHAENI